MSNPITTIILEQLQQENKVLGNIISALKSNKHQLEEQNKKLQHHIHQNSARQTSLQLYNSFTLLFE